MPLNDAPEGVTLAMADPTDEYTIKAVRLAAGRPVLPWAAVPSELAAALDRLYGLGEGALSRGRGGAAAPVAPDDVKRLSDLASDEPVIRYVNWLVAHAAATRASDIHIEANPDRIAQRLRVDGMLRDIDPPPPGLHENIVSRIKIMAGLNIAERRLPQDGRFRLAVEGREIDLRISIVPTLHGESVVMRLLDRERAPLDLAELGFGAELRHALVRLLDLPSGMLLVTGPTGSGKTSTLYASLQLLNTRERKILTVEDPVEYQLTGINQIPVRPAIGLSFATLLRSLLRQDPDVLLVGEIRDLETARIAAQASLTGHLLLSTVHTNDAVEHHRPPARHGARGLSAGVGAARRAGAAPGAHPVPHLPRALRAAAAGRRKRGSRSARRRRRNALSRGRMRANATAPAIAAAPRSPSCWRSTIGSIR